MAVVTVAGTAYLDLGAVQLRRGVQYQRARAGA